MLSGMVSLGGPSEKINRKKEQSLFLWAVERFKGVLRPKHRGQSNQTIQENHKGCFMGVKGQYEKLCQFYRG